MDNLGGDSRDLRTLGIPNPAEKALTPADHETHTRRTGNRFLTTGAVIAALTYLACLAAAAANPAAVDAHPTYRMFTMLAIVTSLSTAAACVAIGGVERITRPLRAANRQLLAADGVRAGEMAEMRRAMSVVAEHLPQALELADWRGYNQAMREGFAQTGTAGPLPGKHLGLVPPRNP